MMRRIKDPTLATLREVVYGDPYHRQFLPLIDEIDWLRTELAAAHAAIDRVRALHGKRTCRQNCLKCEPECIECGAVYPCPTLRAIDWEDA